MSRTNLQSGVERKEKRYCHYPLHLFGLVFVSFQDGYSFFFFYSRDPREITTAIFTWFELSAAISRGYFFFFWRTESWNKSFSRGWKIYTKSFWPGCFKGCSNFSNSYFHSCPSFIFYSILLRIHQMEFRSFVHHLCESSGSDRLRWNSRDFVLVI